MYGRRPFEPRDLPVPRAGEAPPSNPYARRGALRVLRIDGPEERDGEPVNLLPLVPLIRSRENADAAEQQAIADAVEGVVP